MAQDEETLERTFQAGELTLDEAIDAFDASKTEGNARRLLATALEYYGVGMIDGVEFQTLKAQADEVL